MIITIDRAILDDNLLGAGLGPDKESWAGWITLLKAVFALPLSAEEASFFAQVSGNRVPPSAPVREFWAIAGRRSGKSRMAALVACYLACFKRYPRLAVGEIGWVLILASSKGQAKGIFNFCRGFLEASPVLGQEILPDGITADEIRLRNNITIAIHTNSFRSVRGRTIVAALVDELCFWRDETTQNPDVEVIRALIPALSTTRGPIIGLSSPYSQRGVLYDRFQSYFGRDQADVLVVRASTRLLNPLIDEEVIQAAKINDPEAAASEWEAEWRGDLTLYCDRALLERLVECGVTRHEPQERFRYTAFCDPAGGTGADSMTLAIAHKDADRSVLDALLEVRPPFEPAEVVKDFCHLLSAYRIRSVRADHYATGWVQGAFRAEGISLTHSDRPKSELYLDALPLFTNGTAKLLDNPRLIAQLSQLERRTSRVGRDIIDHQRGSQDDLANAAAGALVFASVVRKPIDLSQLQTMANVGYPEFKRLRHPQQIRLQNSGRGVWRTGH
jgi:hypothetical protein